MVKNKLLEGWKSKKLEDLVTIRKGKKQEPIFDEQLAGSKPHILVESFDGIYKKYTTSTQGEYCNKDDILIIWDGSRYGLTATNLEGYVGSTLGIITSTGEVIKEYLFYFLQLNYDKIRRQNKGAGIPHLDKDFLLSFKIVYPESLQEQKKIVAKIDEKMAQIEMMRIEAENQKSSIEDYHFSYLQKLFSGKNEWEFKKFGDLFTTKYGISKAAVEDSSKIKSIRMNNISYDGELILDDVCYLDLDEEELSNQKLKKNDLLFNRTNSAELVGKTTIFDQEGTYVALSYLVVATPRKLNVNTKFVAHYLNTSKMKKYFLNNCDRAISQANFSASKLCDLEIPVPSIHIQNEIVSKIGSLKLELKNMNKIINFQLEAVNQLPNSILNEVFSKYEIPDEA